MATTKTTRSRTTGTRPTTKPRASSAKTDTSIIARTGRTIKQQPYTSAAIATGAVTAVAAAAAGAFFFSRRDKSVSETAQSVTNKVKGSFAEARAKIKDLISSDEKSQQEIAEEALTLKETGVMSPVDELSASKIKTGAVSY